MLQIGGSSSSKGPDIEKEKRMARDRTPWRTRAKSETTHEKKEEEQSERVRSRSPIRRTGDVKTTHPRTIDAWYKKPAAEIIAQASVSGIGLYIDMSKRPIPQKEWEKIEKQNERLNVKTKEKPPLQPILITDKHGNVKKDKDGNDLIKFPTVKEWTDMEIARIIPLMWNYDNKKWNDKNNLV